MNTQKLCLTIGVSLFIVLASCGKSTSTPSGILTPTAIPIPSGILTPSATSGLVSEPSQASAPAAAVISLVCRLPDGTSADEIDFTVFRDSRQIASGEGEGEHGNVYIFEAPAGQYLVETKYGTPTTACLTAIDVTPEQSTYTLVLPYSQVDILVRTTSGHEPMRSYEKLELRPVVYSPTGSPWSLGHYGRDTTIPLEMQEGDYLATLEWENVDGEPRKSEKEFTVVAGEHLTVTLDVIPDIGWLQVEVTFSDAEDDDDAYVSVTDASGDLVGSDHLGSWRPTFEMDVPGGTYIVTVEYGDSATVSYSVEVEAPPRTTTIVRVSDEVGSEPEIESESWPD